MPPTFYNPAITPEFSGLVMQMIRKIPAERPESMRDFLSRFSRIRIYRDDPEAQPDAL